jgi:hypothetical protein
MANKASPAKASQTAELNLQVPIQPAALPRMAYTLHETAKILGVSYISVYRLVQRKKLKCQTALPGRKLIPLREIENFLSKAA